jgi:hypothetical protein
MHPKTWLIPQFDPATLGCRHINHHDSHDVVFFRQPNQDEQKDTVGELSPKLPQELPSFNQLSSMHQPMQSTQLTRFHFGKPWPSSPTSIFKDSWVQWFIIHQLGVAPPFSTPTP